MARAVKESPEEALRRIQEGDSMANFATIYGEFMERGIPQGEIIPRVNVLTYRAWKAKGRQVRKGERSVRIVTYVPVGEQEYGDDGKPLPRMLRPRTAFVFHESQTEPVGGGS